MKTALLMGFLFLSLVSSFDPPSLALQGAIGSTVLTVEEERAKAATPRSEFKDCASGCPVMIVLPAGTFMMGSPEKEAGRRSNEGPRHEVTIAEPLAVSKFEVTFDEWDACVAADVCPNVPDVWGRGAMPGRCP